MLVVIMLGCDADMAEQHPNAPGSVLPKLAWSFAEPAPESAQQLVDRLETYANEIGEGLNREELSQVFPGKTLDVVYYEFPYFPWSKPTYMVHITSTAHELTYAEILFQLHKELHEKVKERAHKYFEGLYLVNKQYRSNIPTYELYLGS